MALARTNPVGTEVTSVLFFPDRPFGFTSGFEPSDEAKRVCEQVANDGIRVSARHAVRDVGWKP